MEPLLTWTFPDMLLKVPYIPEHICVIMYTVPTEDVFYMAAAAIIIAELLDSHFWRSGKWHLRLGIISNMDYARINRHSV